MSMSADVDCCPQGSTSTSESMVLCDRLECKKWMRADDGVGEGRQGRGRVLSVNGLGGSHYSHGKRANCIQSHFDSSIQREPAFVHSTRVIVFRGFRFRFPDVYYVTQRKSANKDLLLMPLQALIFPVFVR